MNLCYFRGIIFNFLTNFCSYKVCYFKVINNTIPTKAGNIFNGWNTKSDGTGQDYVGGGTIEISTNTTLYAKWTPETVTASLSFNNSNELTEGTIATINATANSNITSAVLKIGGDIVKSITPNATSFNTTVNIDDMDNLGSLTFNGTPTAQLTVTTALSSTQNSSSVTVRNLTISNATQLKALATAVNGGTTFSGKTIYQMANITVSSYTPIGYTTSWTSVSQNDGPYFAGTYQGGGKSVTISSLSIPSNLIAGIGIFGKAKNANIKNLEAKGTISASGFDQATVASVF